MIDVYEWHTAMLAGEKPPVHEDVVQCGWYCKRLEARGRLIPCRIFWEPQVDECGDPVGDDVLRCEVAGERRDPVEEWLYLAKYPISEAEYTTLMCELFMADVYRGPTRPAVRWIEEQPNV